MAAYPTLPWMRQGTTLDVDGGFDPQRASNGALKVRKMFGADKVEFTVAHWLTGAQRDTLKAFYAANKLLDVTVTTPWDGAVYTARFTAAPSYEPVGGDRWIGRLKMMEV